MEGLLERPATGFFANEDEENELFREHWRGHPTYYAADFFAKLMDEFWNLDVVCHFTKHLQTRIAKLSTYNRYRMIPVMFEAAAAMSKRSPAKPYFDILDGRGGSIRRKSV